MNEPNRREFLGLATVGGLTLAGCRISGEKVKNTTKKEIIETYRFNIGNIECIIVIDGYMSLPASALFCNAPEESLEQVLREYNLDSDKIKGSISSMVVRTKEHLVLVGTAYGPGGRLIQNLQKEGIEPEDIDTIILPHGHWDHVGWNTDNEGNLVFPNARYVMWKDELDFWTSEKYLKQLDEIHVNSARNNILPIKNKIDVIAQETEILPGINAILAAGHTPGQMVLEISSEEEKLLYLTCVVQSPIHIEYPEWYGGNNGVGFDRKLDNNGLVEKGFFSLPSRNKFLSKAVAEKALVFAPHFYPIIPGYVIQKGERWKFQPISNK
ncbi:MBL fold metallo-hydrolase [Candidatus Latescibacterota bacterium]